MRKASARSRIGSGRFVFRGLKSALGADATTP
jgi:hypothetical protein